MIDYQKEIAELKAEIKALKAKVINKANDHIFTGKDIAIGIAIVALAAGFVLHVLGLI